MAPSWKLLGQRFSALKAATEAEHPGATPESADWMLLCALRDSENIWFDYVGEPYTVGDAVAGLTLSSTVAGWLSATGIYTSVDNTTNLVMGADLSQFLSQNPQPDMDVLLFINTAAIYDLQGAPTAVVPGGNLFAAPNHYVQLQTMPLVSDTQEWVHLDTWSWARTWDGWQGSERFRSNYFGYLRATMS